MQQVLNELAAVKQQLAEAQDGMLQIVQAFTNLRSNTVTKAEVLAIVQEAVANIEVKAPAKTRKRLNRNDYIAVLGHLDDDGNPVTTWRDVAAKTDVPVATVRNYAKMTPEAVAELPDEA